MTATLILVMMKDGTGSSPPVKFTTEKTKEN